MKTINLIGKQILENSDELEDGYAEVQFQIDTLLSDIDRTDIYNYARSWCGLIDPDDYEVDLDDLDNDDLVDHLKEDGFDFSPLIGEEESVDYLTNLGYLIFSPGEKENALDNIDTQKLNLITEKFINSTWKGRDEIFATIEKLC